MAGIFDDIQASPFWWETAPPSDNRVTDAPLPHRVDVAIVGGGFTGMASALRLARAGRDVAVFDTHAPGFGCSSRNGGMVGPSLHKLGVAGLEAKYGKQGAANILGEGLRAVRFFRAFMEEEAIDCDLAWTGRFVGATDAKAYDALGRQSEELKASIGVESDLISRTDQHTEVGSDYFHGGVVYHEDGGLQPAKYVRGLAAKVAEAGARFYAPCPVQHVEKAADGFDLTTPRGKLSARDVIVATNGYTGKELQAFRKRVMPLRSAIFVTEELSDNVMRDMFPHARMHGDRRRLVYYYRPTPDGKRLMFGGRGLPQHDDALAHARDLHKHAKAVFPQIADARIENSWSGTVAYTFDHAPHIGQFDGMYYAMGYCGSGVTRATYLGWQLAGQMLGDRDSHTAFNDLEFKGRPLYTGNPWFLPAVIRWHSMWDRMGY